MLWELNYNIIIQFFNTFTKYIGPGQSRQNEYSFHIHKWVYDMYMQSDWTTFLKSKQTSRQLKTKETANVV